MKKHLFFAFLFFMAVSFGACGSKTTYTNTIDISIPNLNREYNYFLLNDIHLFIENGEIDQEFSSLVSARISEYSLNGKKSSENFKTWITNLDTKTLDGIILNADIEDQLSYANLSYIHNIMSKQPLKYMYLLSDHDLATDWTNPSEDDLQKINALIDGYYSKGFYTFEEEDFIILGINRSWESISSETLGGLKEVFAIGKPIILITHVPYDSLVNSEIADFSKSQKNDRVLLFGTSNDDYYYPNEYMQEFLTMVTSDDSPVVAVIAAHLHGSLKAMLTDTIPEYIVDTGYRGTRTLISIKSE